jgi:hypothetical protein
MTGIRSWMGASRHLEWWSESSRSLPHCQPDPSSDPPDPCEREQFAIVDLDAKWLLRFPCPLPLVETVCGNPAPAKSQRIHNGDHGVEIFDSKPGEVISTPVSLTQQQKRASWSQGRLLRACGKLSQIPIAGAEILLQPPVFRRKRAKSRSRPISTTDVFTYDMRMRTVVQRMVFSTC